MLLLAVLVIANDPLVTTSLGTLRGKYSTIEPTVREFLGIPFAQPPVGPLRWAPPQPATPWDGVRDATAFGASCPQQVVNYQISASNMGPQNEDCLSLNVWATDCPADKAECSRPVLIWLYPGSFKEGSAFLSTYNGAKLAASGAVVVTFNYRLGSLGFLVNDELLSTNNHAVNFGLLDQRLVFQWVKDNAHSFGGDPNRVTLFGDSAGSFSISYHMTLPESNTLFQRAILQSGVQTEYPAYFPTLPVMKALSNAFLGALGCATIECARSITDTSVLLAAQAVIPQWWPVADGTVVPVDVLTALSTGQFNTHLDVLVGNVLNEGTVFANASITAADFATFVSQSFSPALVPVYDVSAYPAPALAHAAIVGDYIFNCPSRTFLALVYDHLKANGHHVYSYLFNDVQDVITCPSSACYLGVYHTSDNPYVFGNAYLPFTPAESALSATIRSSWVQFAASGSFDASWPEWNPEEQAYMTLATPSTYVGNGFRKFYCDLLAPLPAHSPAPSVAPSPAPSAEPSPLPENVCVAHDDLLTCDVIGKIGGCDKHIDSRTTVRDACPLQCGCCSINGECVCNNDSQIHQTASIFGVGWIRGCADALRFVRCDNPFFGATLQKHCACACAHQEHHQH